jgi:hypothetical protein
MEVALKELVSYIGATISRTDVMHRMPIHGTHFPIFPLSSSQYEPKEAPCVFRYSPPLSFTKFLQISFVQPHTDHANILLICEFIMRSRLPRWPPRHFLAAVSPPHRGLPSGHSRASNRRCWSRRRSTGRGDAIVDSAEYKGTKAWFLLPFIFSRQGAAILIETSLDCAA